MGKNIFRSIGRNVGSMIGFCFRFAWENPIISFQLLCVGLLAMLYPQFCFRLFLSPVVVYTAFFLTALLSIGQRQQQEKVAAFERNKEAAKDVKEKPINEVSRLRRMPEEIIVGVSSKEYEEYERIISEIVQEEEEELNDGFVDGKEIPSREAETEVYGNRSLDLGNGELLAPDFQRDIEKVLAPDFQRDQSYTKSVHFSDSLIEGVYRSQLDVIMEEENEEEEHSHTEDLTPRKMDNDSEDEAPMSVSPQSENKEDQHQRKVRLEDFFSLTLQSESAWKSFGHYGASASNNSCTSDDDDDTDSTGCSEDSLGQLGPVLYEVHDPKQSHSIQSNLFAEDSSLPSNDDGEESPVDFHFTWTEEDEGEEKESLFEIVHARDAWTEEDNLIEIALSDQEDPELQEIKETIDQHNTEAKLLEDQEHQEEGKFEGADEENLIEIDLLTHNIGLPEEIEEKIQVQGELFDHFEEDSSIQKDLTPQTESKLEEEIKASEQNLSSPTEPTGKDHEETHPQEAEIGEAKDYSAESSILGLESEEK